ncbi:MAG: hypothetical protein II425_05175, partial [Oscillospiraceae bacterium]|nr:hypothetical protein [Oscillospiraceae bacterium]
MDANTQFRDILNTELNEQKNSASEAETGSTVINTNPAQHTPAEQKVIDEYQAAVDENLVNFVETSMENKGSNKGKYTLKPVSERASAGIKNLTGIDSTGYKTGLEQRMAEHIVDRHGADGAANKFMQDFNDIGRMQYILDNYDRMELAGNTRAYTTNKYNGMPGQAKTVKYIKAVNGTYYVIEAVPDTKAKTAFIVSAYMSGNTKTGNLQTADANAPAYTAKTENAAIPATQTIPQTSANSQEGNAADESLTGSPFLDDVLRNILEKGSKVTNDQARTIAGDGTMLDALAEITGLDLSHIGEQSDGKQRRQAKSAVYQAVGEIRRNSGTAFGTDALSKLGIKVEGNVARYGQTAQLLADVESR